MGNKWEIINATKTDSYSDILKIPSDFNQSLINPSMHPIVNCGTQSQFQSWKIYISSLLRIHLLHKQLGIINYMCYILCTMRTIRIQNLFTLILPKFRAPFIQSDENFCVFIFILIQVLVILLFLSSVRM